MQYTEKDWVRLKVWQYTFSKCVVHDIYIVQILMANCKDTTALQMIECAETECAQTTLTQVEYAADNVLLHCATVGNLEEKGQPDILTQVKYCGAFHKTVWV